MPTATTKRLVPWTVTGGSDFDLTDIKGWVEARTMAEYAEEDLGSDDQPGWVTIVDGDVRDWFDDLGDACDASEDNRREAEDEMNAAVDDAAPDKARELLEELLDGGNALKAIKVLKALKRL